MDRRLQWLGHLGRLNEERLPKKDVVWRAEKSMPCMGQKEVEGPDVKRPAGDWFEGCLHGTKCVRIEQNGVSVV